MSGGLKAWSILAVGAGYWIIDSLVDAFIFHKGHLVSQLIAPSSHDLLMRSLVMVLLMVMLYSLFNVLKLRRIERELLLSENQYRLLFEGNPHPMWVYDLETLRFLAVNNAAVSQYGYSREEFLSMTVKDIQHSEDIPRFLESIAVVKESIACSGTWRHRKKDGCIIYVEIVSDTIFFDGRCAKLVLASDVTTKRESGIEISRTLSLLKATLESTADGILVVDNEGRISSYNEKFADMWKIPLSILESHDDDKALAFVIGQLKDSRAFILKVRELYNNPDATSFDLLEFKDGRIFERYSQPQRMGDAIVGRVWSFRDVTERRRAEEKIRMSEERYRTLFETSKDPIYITHRDGPFIDVNQAALDLFGFTREEMIGMDVRTIYAEPEDRRKFQEEIEQKGFIRDYEIRFRKKNGKEMDCLLTSVLLFDGGGNIVGYQGIIRDVTERKKMEAQIFRAKQDWEETFNTITDMVTIHDKDFNIIRSNAAAKKSWVFNLSMQLRPNVMNIFTEPAIRRKRARVARL